MTIDQLKNNYKKILVKFGKRELKTNKHLKQVIKDIQNHFKVDSYSLTYDGYKEIAEVKVSDLFNICLELKGFIPYYDTKSSRFLIKRKRK